MIDRIELLKSLIDAKIAAHEARKASARPLMAADMVCGGAFPDADRCAARPRMARRAIRVPRGLLEDVQVPSPDPRPPNLQAANLSFAARVVMAVRDRFGGDAPKVYAAARLTRAAYSQIVSDETHPVSKRTAIRFAFALQCDKDEARLLLKSAGYAFSNSKTEDFILQACLEMEPPVRDLEVVNRLLREYRVDFQY